MKQKPLLLLALSLVLLQSCLGAPQVTEPALNPNGQTAAPLTEALPSSTPQPTPLPSHLAQLRVAYILAGNVWFWDASTGARQLTSDGDAWRAKISDDGQVVVYQRNRNTPYEPVSSQGLGSSLWAVNTDGSLPRELTTIPSLVGAAVPLRGGETTLYFDQIKFQPGTHWLYFNTYWSGNQGIVATNDLHRIDVDTPALQTLLSSGGGKLTFSPNGDLLTLASLTDIKVMRADGSGMVNALSYSIESNQDYKPTTVWMNDATGFYTAIPSMGTFRFMYVAANGSFSAQLAEFSPVALEFSRPMISPDGLKVAYWKVNGTRAELHVVEASTADTVIASYENPPMFELYGWSPDSKRVVFFISDRLFPFAAGIGLPPAPLTESAAPDSLRWIDAEHFIFFREGRLLVGQVGTSQTFEIESGFDKVAETVNFYDFVLLPSP